MPAMIYVLNGPNLNLLGQREPETYGQDTMADVEARCAPIARDGGLGQTFLQSNHEGQIIDWIQEAREHAAGIIINAGALTHTSVAVLDALNTFDGPVIEVHISQVHKREEFRQHSFISQRADAVIVGCGVHGYALAMQHMGKLVGTADK